MSTEKESTDYYTKLLHEVTWQQRLGEMDYHVLL